MVWMIRGKPCGSWTQVGIQKIAQEKQARTRLEMSQRAQTDARFKSVLRPGESRSPPLNSGCRYIKQVIRYPQIFVYKKIGCGRRLVIDPTAKVAASPNTIAPRVPAPRVPAPRAATSAFVPTATRRAPAFIPTAAQRAPAVSVKPGAFATTPTKVVRTPITPAPVVPVAASKPGFDVAKILPLVVGAGAALLMMRG